MNWKKLAKIYGRPTFLKFGLINPENDDEISAQFISPYRENQDYTNDEFGPYPITNFNLKIFIDPHNQNTVYMIDLNDFILDRKNPIIFKECPNLSEMLFSFPSIVRLKVVQESLEVIPDLFNLLPNIESLKIRSSKLKIFPQSIEHLPKLKDLLVAINHYTEIPTIIGQMIQIQFLALEMNKVENIPNFLSNLIHLTHFCLESESVKELPSFIFEFSNLKYQFLNTKNIEYLPDLKKESLTIKEIVWNLESLKELPPNLDNFAHLKYCFLYVPSLRSAKGIENIHSEDLTLFTNVDFDSGVKLSDSILALKFMSKSVKLFPKFPSNLKILELYVEEMETLPDEIFDLAELDTLRIASNKILSIPKKIVNLRNLRILNIVETALPELPTFILELPKIELIQLSHDTKFSMESKPKALDISYENKEFSEKKPVYSTQEQLPYDINFINSVDLFRDMSKIGFNT